VLLLSTILPGTDETPFAGVPEQVSGAEAERLRKQQWKPELILGPLARTSRAVAV
jgi:hypothetical protein